MSEVVFYERDPQTVMRLIAAGLPVRPKWELEPNWKPKPGWSAPPIRRLKPVQPRKPVRVAPPAAWGFVYVFAAGDLVKVGMSDAGVKARWASIRCSNPLLEPALFVSAPLGNRAREVERRALQALSEYCAGGEWFRCAREEVIATVRRIIDETR